MNNSIIESICKLAEYGWIHDIPYKKFPKRFEVKEKYYFVDNTMIVNFEIRDKIYKKATVNMYIDILGKINNIGSLYWDLNYNINGDVIRFICSDKFYDDIDKTIEEIIKSITSQILKKYLINFDYFDDYR